MGPSSYPMERDTAGVTAVGVGGKGIAAATVVRIMAGVAAGADDAPADKAVELWQVPRSLGADCANPGGLSRRERRRGWRGTEV